MYEVTWIRFLGLASLYALLLGGSTHALLGDALLVQSDALSLATYLGGMTFVLTPVLLMLCSPILLFSTRTRGRFCQLCHLGAAAVIGTIFLLLSTLYAGARLQLSAIENLGSEYRKLFVVAAVFLLLVTAYIWRSKKRDEIADRVGRISLAMFTLTFVGLPLAVGYWHLGFRLERDEGDSARRHLVLIVLDGMPASYVTAYNPKAVPTPIDDVTKQGIVFRQFRTVAPWTSGFFSCLYTGHASAVHGAYADRRPRANLLARLQQAGVSSQWIAYHRNGIPEGNASRVSDYDGLRSYFLTHRYAWIPEVLGLDYHITIAGKAMLQSLPDGLAKAAFNTLNGAEPIQNAFVDVLLPRLQAQRSRAQRTFTIFHVWWQDTGVGAVFDSTELPVAWDDDGPLAQPTAVMSAEIKANDYRYRAEHESYAKRLRHATAVRMGVLGRHLATFIAALATDGRRSDTTVIVTADHGTMFTKRRFWYGYHPNEEVLRVPLIVLNTGRTGFDDRLFSTPDLANSVLDFFDVTPALDPEALSIFGTRERLFTASATLRSDIHKEWFIVLALKDLKYQSNIHPDGDGKTQVLKVRNFDESLVRETPGPPSEVAAQLALGEKRLGIGFRSLHPAYR